MGIEPDKVSPARPSHRPYFDCVQDANAEGENLRAFIGWEHLLDGSINVYLVYRQRGKGSLTEGTHFHACVLHPKH